jgi:hypothetical protein
VSPGVQAGVGLVFDNPALPERLPSLSPAQTREYFETYRRDWIDDTRDWGDGIRSFCRRSVFPKKFQGPKRPGGPSLQTLTELGRLPAGARLFSTQGLQGVLQARLREFARSPGNPLTREEKGTVGKLLDLVAHDRGELYEQVASAQWLMLRVAYRRYNEIVDHEARLGALAGVNLFGGNARLCGALELRRERNQRLAEATREIERTLAALEAERGR